MSRRSLALVIIMAMLGALSAPAGAQSTENSERDTEDIAVLSEVELLALEADLMDRQGQITDQISEIESMLIDLDTQEASILDEIDVFRGQIERVGDELERLSLQRRQPAIIRARVAVNQFVSGDPAAQAFALEVQALGGSDAAQDPLQQQEVFDSIIESAQADLARVDSEIEQALVTVSALRAERADMGARVDDLVVVRASLNDELATSTQELERSEEDLARVTEELEWFRDLDGRSVLTGRQAAGAANRPALVVKIDNVVRARPQAGINDADIVFVELVEGGFTRYAAVFQSENVGTVGPVRSMRTTDLNLLAPLNRPLFASSGANSRTTQAVNASSLVNISAATGAGGAYFRNNSRSAPHNLFSTDSALRNSSSSGGAPPRMFTIRRPGTPLRNSSVASNGVNVNYRSTTVNYSWNGSGWDRTQDGSATVDTNGVRTAPETVIVRFTRYGTSPADAASPEAITVGSGVAWIFTEGRLIEGSWSKPTAAAVTEYADSDGNPVEIQPGRVWVELPRPGNASLR